MKEFFVSRSSAVARIVATRQDWLNDPGKESRLDDDAQRLALGQLDQLLFDVRARRIDDFVLPSTGGEVRMFITDS
jgi:hypothetical protein